MAKKSDKKKTETKTDEPIATSSTNSGRVSKRYEAVDPKRVYAELEKHNLPTDGGEIERADRLCFFLSHEEQKKKTEDKVEMIDCQPDDPTDPLGCGFESPDGYDVCPFCGKGGEIIKVLKETPKADSVIEYNVKTAEKKAEDKKEVAITSKELRKKKKDRGEVVEEKPTNPLNDEKAIVKPESEALDLPSHSVAGTIADFDRLASEIDEIHHNAASVQAVAMWKIGRKLTEINDRKLWCLVKNEDGGFAYSGFIQSAAQRWDYSPDHTRLMLRWSANMTVEEAEMGVAKAKAILSEKIPDALIPQLKEFALQKDKDGKFVNGLRALWTKIENLQKPQLPAGPPVIANPSSDDTKSDEDDDDSDDDGDEAADSTRTPSTTTPARPAQMTSLSFEKKEFFLPLAQKGSQIKPAKKIADEPHGTLALPMGAKLHFVVKTGEDGQLFLEGRVETPY